MGGRVLWVSWERFMGLWVSLRERALCYLTSTSSGISGFLLGCMNVYHVGGTGLLPLSVQALSVPGL